MQADQASSRRGSPCVERIAASPRQATSTSPRRGSTPRRDRRRTSRARSRRRGSAPRPGRRARSRPGRDHVVDGAAAAVEVPEPRLAAEQGHARRAARGARRRRSGSRRRSRPCRGRRPRPAAPACGQRLAQLLGLGVDHRQLLQPLGRGDAVPVAGPVEVAVVEVGQRGPCSTAARPRRRSARRPGRRRRSSAPRWAATVRPLPRELALVDHRDRARPAPASRAKAVGCGCHSSGSTSLSQNSALSSWSVPGHPRGEADQPVRARRSGRCRARSGWSRWSTARRRCRARGRPSSEERNGAACGVALEQLGAEPVDQEDDVRRRRRAAPARSARLAERRVPRARGDRRHDVAERAVAVGRARRRPARRGDQPRGCARRAPRRRRAAGPRRPAPSAAAETRSEKSSEASTPV